MILICECFSFASDPLRQQVQKRSKKVMFRASKCESDASAKVTWPQKSAKSKCRCAYHKASAKVMQVFPLSQPRISFFNKAAWKN
jgi:hypothetical protein